MPYPVHYFDAAGRAIQGAAKAATVFEYAKKELGLGEEEVAAVIRVLAMAGMSVTLTDEPFPGQVARVRIDAYGESASEVEATLLAYGSRCDAASQADSVSYGECVIERNLEEQWGETYSWRGRLILHPAIGTIESSQRATEALRST